MRSRGPVPWQLAFALLGATWGCSFFFIKLGLQSFTPVQVAFGRLAIGALTLLVIALVTRSGLPRRRETWRHLAVSALLFSSIPFVLFSWAETQVSSILASIVNSMTPLATLLVVLAAFPEEHLTRQRVVGLLVGFGGALVVIGIWNGIGGGELAGVLACVGAIACYAVAFPYMRRHLAATGDGPIAIATAQTTLGALFLVPVVAGAALAGAGEVRTPVAMDTILGMLALGSLGSGIAYILNTHIVMTAGGTIASSVTYVTPIFAVVVGALVLSEPLSWNQPVGGAIVLLGVAISQGRLQLPARAVTAAGRT